MHSWLTLTFFVTHNRIFMTDPGQHLPAGSSWINISSWSMPMRRFNSWMLRFPEWLLTFRMRMCFWGGRRLGFGCMTLVLWLVPRPVPTPSLRPLDPGPIPDVSSRTCSASRHVTWPTPIARTRTTHECVMVHAAPRGPCRFSPTCPIVLHIV